MYIYIYIYIYTYIGLCTYTFHTLAYTNTLSYAHNVFMGPSSVISNTSALVRKPGLGYGLRKVYGQINALLRAQRFYGSVIRLIKYFSVCP